MAYSKLEFNKSVTDASCADEDSLDLPMTSHGGKNMFSLRNLTVAGVACIPVLGLHLVPSSALPGCVRS